MAPKITRGIEQRDAAIKAGAGGATTLLFDKDRLYMPGVDGEIEISIKKMIMEGLKPEQRDVIIIGSADTALFAELGSISAAFELLKTS
jgi:hypothetical protein